MASAGGSKRAALGLPPRASLYATDFTVVRIHAFAARYLCAIGFPYKRRWPLLYVERTSALSSQHYRHHRPLAPSNQASNPISIQKIRFPSRYCSKSSHDRTAFTRLTGARRVEIISWISSQSALRDAKKLFALMVAAFPPRPTPGFGFAQGPDCVQASARMGKSQPRAADPAGRS
jgi:hypothetical protein